ncbi:hypothetical protein AAFO92_13115 [Roseovarius sp. CAU 1744]|uniref:hypothetical protein n=1 Tax=Roseovarius sp. CAU 1744 TaxID=3140368 RepID=UPI00325A5BA0
MLRLAVLLLVFATHAQAGPWPRGKGKVFYSAHANGEYIEEFGIIRQYGSIYAEYGLTDKITLGVDYNGSEIATDKAIAFLRIPLGRTDRTYRFAAELGAGLVDGETVLRPGFSVGRGITWRDRSGWITLDTRAILGEASAGMRIESDFTFGISATPRTKVILQLQGGIQSEGDDYLKFAPSVVFELKQRKARSKRKKRKGKQYVEFGITTGIVNYENYGAKLGIWREF